MRHYYSKEALGWIKRKEKRKRKNKETGKLEAKPKRKRGERKHFTAHDGTTTTFKVYKRRGGCSSVRRICISCQKANAEKDSKLCLPCQNLVG